MFLQFFTGRLPVDERPCECSTCRYVGLLLAQTSICTAIKVAPLSADIEMQLEAEKQGYAKRIQRLDQEFRLLNLYIDETFADSHSPCLNKIWAK